MSGRKDDLYFQTLEQQALGLETYRAVLRAAEAKIVLDIGGNIGLSVLAAHDLNTRKITALEPSPRNFRMLNENIRANAVSAEAINLAAASEPGVLTFNDSEFGAGAHVVQTSTLHSPSTIQVDAVPIDSLLDRLEKTDVLKIDVEGFEMTALEGATRLIAEHRPTAFMELNSWTLIAFANLNPRSLIERFMALFPIVLYPNKAGKFVRLSTSIDLNTLIYNNIVLNGGVDDLVGTFSEDVAARLQSV